MPPLNSLEALLPVHASTFFACTNLLPALAARTALASTVGDVRDDSEQVQIILPAVPGLIGAPPPLCEDVPFIVEEEDAAASAPHAPPRGNRLSAIDLGLGLGQASSSAC